MYKKVYLVTFFLLHALLANIPGMCFSLPDNSKIDSLTLGLRKETNDTGKVILYNKLSYQYLLKSDFKNALEYGNKAFILSERAKYAVGKAKSLINIGNAYGLVLDNEKAEKYYLEANVIAQKIGNTKIQSDCYNNLGEVCRDYGKYPKALGYYIKSLKLEEKLGNKEGIAISYNNIGIVYKNIGLTDKAIKSYEQSIEIANSINDEHIICTNYVNIANIYSDIKNYTSAIEYYDKALQLSKKLNKASSTVYALYGMGVVYSNQNQLELSMKYLQEAYTEGEKHEQKDIVASALKQIGIVYEKKNNVTEAIKYISKALELENEIGLRAEIVESYLKLSRLYSKANKNTKALEYLDLYTALNDSVYNKETRKQIAEIQEKYESEKKQKENEVLEQKNRVQNLKIEQNRTLIYGLSTLTILIVLITVLYIRQNRINASYAKMEIEQRLLRSQMNPHFIFNAMVGIQNSIYKEEPEKAANYLTSIAYLTQSIIENSKKEFVLLENEIATLQHYLTLQKIRFTDKFDYTIESDSEIHTENTFIPPMMAQPVIENAIVHGVMHKTDGKGLIKVKFSTKDDKLMLEIEDNGVGRIKAKEYDIKENKHLSVATNITQERLKILNRKYKNKFTMEIVDLKNENNEATGTKIIFLFPLLLRS